MTLLCKKKIAKSKEERMGSNLAESFKECYGSRRAVLPVMVVMNGSGISAVLPRL
jgi:hypothetical protein